MDQDENTIIAGIEATHLAGMDLRYGKGSLLADLIGANALTTKNKPVGNYDLITNDDGSPGTSEIILDDRHRHTCPRCGELFMGTYDV